MTSLHARLQDLASSFADSVLAAIRTASLEELAAADHSPKITAPRPRPRVAGAHAKAPAAPAPRTKRGRLARRSPEDVAKTLGLVVAALQGVKDEGMRAEGIRTLLGLDRRELPRVLAEGLKTKKLRSKGQKRATTYFLA